MKRICLLALLTLSPALGAQSIAVPPQLLEYVSKADDAYAWKLGTVTVEDGHTIANLALTSQKWQNEVWEHEVQIVLPKDVKPTATVLLYNTGGKASPAMSAFALRLAQKSKVPVVLLFGIPKQPLYGKKEDSLIAETFVKYLETQDASWPLLFPMVKSVVKCMDAVQAFAKQEWKHDVKGFVITGASKRGWTTYLTAATGDPRVKAIAPMVFDSLNMREQMPHQVKSFGAYSAMIHDYQERKLLPLPDTDAARQLWAMVDPWVYLEKLKLPKLIILGTNDPYWTQDALNLYWKDLKGPKSVLYVPNAGHDLRPMKDPAAAKPEKDIFPMKAVDALAAFTQCVQQGVEFPSIAVTQRQGDNGEPYFGYSFQGDPEVVRIWRAKSDSRDFRKCKWYHRGDQKVEPNDARTILADSTADFCAAFLEADFNIDGVKFSLSTPMLVTESKK